MSWIDPDLGAVSEAPTARPAKLAIIITCFNYEQYVGRAIASVVRQARRDCEIIVVDDGSSDGSWEVITRSGVTACRIENAGQRAACLFGLDRTNAPFVLFLDADDELKPGALDVILTRLDPGVAKLQFALTRIDADGRTIDARYPALANFRERDRLVRLVLRTAVYPTPPTSGNVFRRDVCELLRECDYDRAVDGVILFAAPFMGDVISIADDLGLYRIHDRNDSGLGRAPAAASLERDLRRFVARIDHLRRVVRRFYPQARLVEPRNTYYYRMTQFSMLIAEGRRPTPWAFGALMCTLLVEPRATRTKLGLMAFCAITYLSPIERGKALLDYRFAVGRRSLRALLQAAWRPGRAWR